MRQISLRSIVAFILSSSALLGVASAQSPITTPRGTDFSPQLSAPSKKAAPKKTIVEFELLQSVEGGGLHSQQWLKVLEPLDVSVRIHRSIKSDKLELREREVGSYRYVTAVGTLDRSGSISFPDRSFVVGDSVKLKEWIDELRTYGVQGTPTGQPLWGLTQDQFEKIYDSLVKPVDFETEGLPLEQMASKLPLPPQHALRWHADAKAEIRRRGDRTKLRQELKGISIATALAIALSDNGLGFHPNRTPAGDLELLIVPRALQSEQWPVGWPIKRQSFKAAPKLYAMVPIELSDVELSDVLNAISRLAETPIFFDYTELDAKQIQLDKIKVSFPRKTTTWTIALRQLVAPQKLTRELWQDEAGRVFIWITTTRAGRVKDTDKSEP